EKTHKLYRNRSSPGFLSRIGGPVRPLFGFVVREEITMAQQLGKIKHFFLGTNTGQGFYSFYGQLGKEVSTRLFIIKGGPGTGKSTFMQKIGQEMLSRGFPVEFAHCSSDSNSLDGVLLPSLGIALVDGTSPHIVDPVYPGVVGEILNFGDFWDEKALREKK